MKEVRFADDNTVSAEHIVKVVYVSVVCVIAAITLNSVLIYKLIWKMRNSYLRGTLIVKLVISLAAANITSCSVNGSVLLSSVLASRWRYGQHACDLHAAAIEFDALFTSLLVMIICIERHLACNRKSNSFGHNLFTKSSTCGILIVVTASLAPIVTVETVQVYVAAPAYPVAYTCRQALTAPQYCLLGAGVALPYLISVCALLRTLTMRTSRWCRSKATSWYVLALLVAMPIVNVPYLVVGHLRGRDRGAGAVATLLKFSHPIVLPVFTMIWRRYHIKKFKLNRAKIRDDCCRIEGLTLYASRNGLKLIDGGGGYGVYHFNSGSGTSEDTQSTGSGNRGGNKDTRNGHNRIHDNTGEDDKTRLKNIKKTRKLRIRSVKAREIKVTTEDGATSSGVLTQTTSLNTLSELNESTLLDEIEHCKQIEDIISIHKTPVS